MDIDIIDTDAATRRILTAPLDQRPALLREMLAPVAGMYRFMPGEVDLVAAHHVGSGFRVDRDDPHALPGLERLHDADAWNRMRTAIERAMNAQEEATPGFARPEKLQVVLVLGDSHNSLFMDVNLGMVAAGGTPGYLWIGLWPSDENLERLEATVTHELSHQLRYHTVVWNPMTVTVGEQIVSEGLADAFARSLYGDELGYTRIGVPPQGDEESYRRVVENLGVSGMQNFSAWVLGDEITAEHGGTPVGLPTGIGYAVGSRIVDAYLRRTGRTITQAMFDDASEILRVGTAA